MSEEEIKNRKIARRRLLRRAGAVAAGVAGAGVVSAVAAEPALAAPGSFDSSTVNTAAVTATNATDSVELIGGQNVTTSGPSLRLVPNEGAETISSSAPPGSFAIDGDGTLWSMISPQGAGPYRSFVYDTFNASQTWPIVPTRVMDSRGLGVGRSNVISPAPSDFNPSTGALRAGRWIHLDLTDEVKFGYAVIGMLAVALPLSGGHIAVVPYGAVDYNQPPGTANILFAPGIYLQNMLFCGIGGSSGGPSTDVISLYSTAETHVVIDVMGFVTDSIGRIAQYNPSAGGSGLRAATSHMAERKAMIAREGQLS